MTPTVTPSHCSQAGNKLQDWNVANALSVGGIRELGEPVLPDEEREH